MSESVTMRRAQTHVVWQTPGSPSIRIGKRAMYGIFSDVLSVFVSVPRRGAETGGILLGRNTGDEIVIDDFEPVACEHRFGPSSYRTDIRLSDSVWGDRDRAWIGAWRNQSEAGADARISSLVRTRKPLRMKTMRAAYPDPDTRRLLPHWRWIGSQITPA